MAYVKRPGEDIIIHSICLTFVNVLDGNALNLERSRRPSSSFLSECSPTLLCTGLDGVLKHMTVLATDLRSGAVLSPFVYRTYEKEGQ